MKWLKFFAPVIILSLVMIGCGGGPASMEVSPSTVKLEKADATATLAVKFMDAKGNEAQPKGTVTWSTSDANVAVVSDGTVTAKGSGKAVITATAGELTATATVVVQIPGKVKIAGAGSITLEVGGSANLSATILDTAGEPITGKQVSWSSGNPGIATVGDGAVSAVSEGQTVITASYMGLNDEVKVTVTAKKPVEKEELKLKKKEKTEKKPAKPAGLKLKKKN